MRLIDADKIDFKEEVDPFEVPAAQYVVEQLPTIEAIPIEWIEEYCAENWVEYSSQHDAIRRMLEDWGKENETR